MKIKIKIFTTLALATLMGSSYVGAVITNPTNYNPENVTTLTKTALNNEVIETVTPQDYEKQLSTLTLLDSNKKVIFVNNVDDANNSKTFWNNIDFLSSLKSNTAELSSSKYTLTKDEINDLSKQYNTCTYRNSTTCLKTITTSAQDMSKGKENWNQLIILISQVVIGLNIIALLVNILNSDLVASRFGSED